MEMNVRQRIMKAFYPLIMKASKAGKRGQSFENTKNKTPKVSFYHLKANRNDGSVLDFEKLKNKKVMIVNTASNCGFTSQYNDLQKLYEDYSDKLVILGIPSNDFKEQEKGNDAEIASFCQINFGVTFPLLTKSRVLKGNDQHPIYAWLTSSSKNGWNDHQPDWNFSKYLIDENGTLIKYLGPSVSPLDASVIQFLD
jgi:glutathione peroxidase